MTRETIKFAASRFARDGKKEGENSLTPGWKFRCVARIIDMLMLAFYPPVAFEKNHSISFDNRIEIFTIVYLFFFTSKDRSTDILDHLELINEAFASR